MILDLFRRSGALLEGHFLLSSGLHSPGYLQCALVLQHPRQAETLGRALAEVEYGGKPFEDYIKPENRTLAGELINGIERYLDETEKLVQQQEFLAAVRAKKA